MDPILTLNWTTINSANPDRLAAFWAALLGGTPRHVGNEFILVDPGNNKPKLLFQQSQTQQSALGWFHLDCSAADRSKAIESITQLGGEFVERREDSEGDWIVMRDPDGNPFCI